MQKILANKNKKEAEEISKSEIFVKSQNDKWLPPARHSKKAIFNEIFTKGVNAQLIGNCLRWKAS